MRASFFYGGGAAALVALCDAHLATVPEKHHDTAAELHLNGPGAVRGDFKRISHDVIVDCDFCDAGFPARRPEGAI